MVMLVPVRTQKFELAYLSCRTDMLTDTRAHIVIAYLDESYFLRSIFRQTFECYLRANGCVPQVHK